MPKRPNTIPPLHLIEHVPPPEPAKPRRPPDAAAPVRFDQRISVPIADAVAATGLTRAGIYRAHTQGRLPFPKYGRVSLIRVEALNRLLDEMTVQRGTGQESSPAGEPVPRRGRRPAEIDGSELARPIQHGNASTAS